VGQDFYTTMAQVLPVVLLALVWDSKYLERLRAEKRISRWAEPHGDVWFWTKPRVRTYSIVVFGALTAGIAITMAILAGVLPPWTALRIGLLVVLGVGLATLAVRILVDVVLATSSEPKPAEPDAGEADT
jgi:hypothetical protein